MRIVSVLGAGRSAGYLIDYLAGSATVNDFSLRVYDSQFDLFFQSFKPHDHVQYLVSDVLNENELKSIANDSFAIVSLLPPAFHIQIAKACLESNCHLATASYISDAMKSLHESAAAKELVFLNELGLDPGLDHISAHHAFEYIRHLGAEIVGFESYCGGLISQENCLDNPWEYKITWNPMNVVLAGQGGPSIWLKNGKQQSANWNQLFQFSEKLNIPQLGTFDAYPNRDSLSYIEGYGLQNVHTMLRGTLRRVGYCKAWNCLVMAGFTNHEVKIPDTLKSLKDWFQWVTQFDSSYEWLKSINADEDIQSKINYLGLDAEIEFPKFATTSAEVLLEVLKEKWKLGAFDKDEVVMCHRIEFTKNGKSGMMISSLHVLGDGGAHTAMAKTVGLPLAMGVELLVKNKIESKGVIMPFNNTWATIIKNQLEDCDIQFVDEIFWD